MIRKKLEAYHMLGIEIDSFSGMLDDWVVKKYFHHKSVREYKRMILEHVEQVKRKRNYIINLINRLKDSLLREIFFMRYIDQKSNEEIGRKVGYSVNYILYILRKDIEKIEKMEG